MQGLNIHMDDIPHVDVPGVGRWLTPRIPGESLGERNWYDICGQNGRLSVPTVQEFLRAYEFFRKEQPRVADSMEEYPPLMLRAVVVWPNTWNKTYPKDVYPYILRPREFSTCLPYLIDGPRVVMKEGGAWVIEGREQTPLNLQFDDSGVKLSAEVRSLGLRQGDMFYGFEEQLSNRDGITYVLYGFQRDRGRQCRVVRADVEAKGAVKARGAHVALHLIERAAPESAREAAGEAAEGAAAS